MEYMFPVLFLATRSYEECSGWFEELHFHAKVTHITADRFVFSQAEWILEAAGEFRQLKCSPRR
jgi:hypothetical protein